MARQLDVPRNRVDQFKSRSTRPNYEFLQKLMVTYPQLSAEFVLTGKGDVLKRVAEEVSPMDEDASLGATISGEVYPVDSTVEDLSKDIIIKSLTDTIQRLQKEMQQK